MGVIDDTPRGRAIYILKGLGQEYLAMKPVKLSIKLDIHPSTETKDIRGTVTYDPFPTYNNLVRRSIMLAFLTGIGYDPTDRDLLLSVYMEIPA
jgi:hypothetical protein